MTLSLSARSAPMTLTSAAIAQVKALLSKRGTPSAGIRIGVKTRGCSGRAYVLEFADTIAPTDEVVDAGDIKVLIDTKALLYLVGTEMDYTSDAVQSGFSFKNPNEKGRCGCGESFRV